MLFRKERSVTTFVLEGRVLIVLVLTAGILAGMALGGDLHDFGRWAQALLPLARVLP